MDVGVARLACPQHFPFLLPAVFPEVFYQFAREYFSSLCRVLTMDISLIQNE